MDLRADSRLPFPRDRVFSTYRDDILQLVPYLSNVRSIEIKSRKDNGPVVEMVNEWYGGGEIPAAVRAVISESMLSWTDYAIWNATSMECEWRIETRAFTEAVHCAGRNAFVDDGAGGTTLQVRGTLDIDPKKLRGVPGFLAGKIARGVESFLVERIQSNLVDTAKGLSAYLQKRTANYRGDPGAECGFAVLSTTSRSRAEGGSPSGRRRTRRRLTLRIA